MNIWKILDIDPTSNARSIKRAYARQLAKHHPEDDPEGFQLVQSAYERALLIARGSKGASEDVSPSLDVNVAPPEPVAAKGQAAKATEMTAATEMAATEMAGVSAQSTEPAHDNAPETSRPRIARGDGVFADVEAEASEVAWAAGASGASAGKDATGGESDYMVDKMLRDIRHREDAMRWIDDLEHDLISTGDAVAALRRLPATEYMDVEGADQAVANLLRPYARRMRRRDLDELERALGRAAEQDALRALFVRRREEYAKRRREVLSVLASMVLLAVFLSLRVWQVDRKVERWQEMQQEVEQMRQDAAERQDLLDSQDLSFDVSSATQEARRGLDAVAESNRAKILDYLQQEYGVEFALEDDPAFIPGHTDQVLATALDPAGKRYGIMADVDEDYLICEIRAVVEVDDEEGDELAPEGDAGA